MNSTIELTSADMAGKTEIYLKLAPTSDVIDKQSTIVHDGNNFVSLSEQNYSQLLQGSYKLTYNSTAQKGQYAKLAILETRSINITLTEASKQMLTDKLTLIAGHGDKNDVKITTPSTSNTINVDKGTEETLILSFAIKENKYFIPNITVNNQVYPTVDTGMTDEEGHILICSTLKGSAASVSSLKVDLSIFAEVTTNNESETIQELNASYEVMKEGALINAGEYGLTANDTAKDPMVNDVLVTFDLGLTKDAVEAHEVADGMEVHLGLDVVTFADGDYKVVRNHEGQVEALDTTCKFIRDPGTGEVKGLDVAFTSDKFSEYSIVSANWSPAVPEESTTAQTGDNLPIMSLFAIAGIALCFVLFSNRKSKIIRK